MAKFFVGQRVRKVRGKYSIGVTGRVVTIDPADPMGNTLFIRTDSAVRLMCGQEDCGFGYEGWGRPDHWEPTLPSGHTASTESFQELMDRLNTQRVEKVEEVGA